MMGAAGSTDTKGTKRDRDDEGSAMECEDHHTDAAGEPHQPSEKQQCSSRPAVPSSSERAPANPADYEGACMVYVSPSTSNALPNRGFAP